MLHWRIMVELDGPRSDPSPRCATTCPTSRTVVAPPYDVISARAARRAPRPQSVQRRPPDASRSEEQAARDLAAWRESGVLVEDAEPSFWWLAQEYVGPDGVERTREGFVAALHVEPYANARRAAARAHACRPEGGAAAAAARDAHAARADLPALGRVARDRRPRRAGPRRRGERRHARLWRLDAEFGDALTEELQDAQLLIADGHHRYETALAFHEEDGTEASAWLLVVIVPTDQEGLTIFPTHRIAQSVDGVSGTPIDRPATRCPASCSTDDGRYELIEGDGLDPEVVDRLAPQGVTYTPYASEAVAAVDRGEAEAAFLLRPTRIEDVWEIAGRGDVMPQKSTFFYPKLTSGLLFFPL